MGPHHNARKITIIQINRSLRACDLKIVFNLVPDYTIEVEDCKLEQLSMILIFK